MGKWAEPVIFDDTCKGLDGVYTATSDALIALRAKWPKTSGKDYQTAMSVCEAALSGQARHDEARRAFLHAADEIGIFARVC